jgi:Asp-tRNA(Asn)/Glu-tRNA(Gln) amidotransferase B subunit
MPKAAASKQRPSTPATLAALIRRVADATVSNNGARQVFEALWTGEGTDVDALIEAKGLKQMNDTGELEAIVDAVIAANEKSVAEFRAGKDKAFNALVGQVMKASKGKANPAQAGELLRRRLEPDEAPQRGLAGGGLPLVPGSGPREPAGAPAHSLRRRSSSAS